MHRANAYSSRILRIGLVNSGMFETLDINMDVQAIHLVGHNNVGKTSLIALIQFLYFPFVREMTFSKSLAETQHFYFRPEGSYILFEVRTMTGTQRTVGIYGTGSSTSRLPFVFDGGFDLQDFLDERQCVLPYDRAQGNLIERTVRKYQRFEDYERALVGQHTDATLNVPLFDLGVSEFRLLRQLLQGLLRLDRIASADVQEFLIKLIESSGVTTRINVVEDYEQSYRQIQQNQHRLNDLKQLEPVIRQWKTLEGQITQLEGELKAEEERLYHLSGCYCDAMQSQYDELQAEYEVIRHDQAQLRDHRDALIYDQSEQRHRLHELGADLEAFKRHQLATTEHSQVHVAEQLERLREQRVELKAMLRQVAPQDLAKLQRELSQLQHQAEMLSRRIRDYTVEQVLDRANLSAEHRALLRFLISTRLVSLRVKNTIVDEEAFWATIHEALACLDEEGFFRGFGLVIPRSQWFVDISDVVSPAEQLESLKERIAVKQKQITVAQDREKKDQECRALDNQIEHCNEILSAYAELSDLEIKHGSYDHCKDKHRCSLSVLETFAQRIEDNEQQQVELQQRSEKLHTRLDRCGLDIDQARRTHSALRVFDTDCPAGIENLTTEDLEHEYASMCRRVDTAKRDIERLRRQLAEPRTMLQERYDREGPEQSFDDWIIRNLDIAREIDRVEATISDHYRNLMAQMSSGLSKLIKAYQEVDSRVAGLNSMIRGAQVSNIDRIQVGVTRSQVMEAIEETGQHQLQLFSLTDQTLAFDEAQALVDDYLSQIRSHGRELRLKDLFRLEFHISFVDSEDPKISTEIHQTESHGTETAVKVVLYLGLIRLLQNQRRTSNARIPFFLDEVGSIDPHNLRQLIDYCDRNNFLPIFASPEIRSDIPYNYVFRRQGNRSVLANTIVISAPSQDTLDEAA